MDNLRIAVCDDDAQDREGLLSLIAQLDAAAVCTEFTSGAELAEKYQYGRFDLILIDIYMPGCTGVEAVSQIRRTDGNVMIAFTTTSTEHALDAYRLEVARYLEKPVAAAQLMRTLAAARERRAPSMAIGHESIPFDSIMYFEQSAHSLHIFLADGRELRMTDKLDNIERIATDSFMRCHKSYLVNLAFVRAIDRDLMVFRMCSGHNVHIRRDSFATARRRYEEYLFSSTRRFGDA